MCHNLDLIQMFYLPKTLDCPRCKIEQRTYFEEYDIDCGDPNPTPGLWKLSCHCNDCDFSWIYSFVCKIEIYKSLSDML